MRRAIPLIVVMLLVFATPGWAAPGIELVKDIWPGSDGSGPYPLTDVGGTLYFVADDGTHGSELWKSDGTEFGTVMVEDLRRGDKGSRPAGITDVGGTAFFTAEKPRTGLELWMAAPA